MKAYRSEKDDVLLYRPDMNMFRMNFSAKRIGLPVNLNIKTTFRLFQETN